MTRDSLEEGTQKLSTLIMNILIITIGKEIKKETIYVLNATIGEHAIKAMNLLAMIAEKTQSNTI